MERLPARVAEQRRRDAAAGSCRQLARARLAQSFGAGPAISSRRRAQGLGYKDGQRTGLWQARWRGGRAASPEARCARHRAGWRSQGLSGRCSSFCGSRRRPCLPLCCLWVQTRCTAHNTLSRAIQSEVSGNGVDGEPLVLQCRRCACWHAALAMPLHAHAVGRRGRARAAAYNAAMNQSAMHKPSSSWRSRAGCEAARRRGSGGGGRCRWRGLAAARIAVICSKQPS